VTNIRRGKVGEFGMVTIWSYSVAIYKQTVCVTTPDCQYWGVALVDTHDDVTVQFSGHFWCILDGLCVTS
jgi:hypothetical protein